MLGYTFQQEADWLTSRCLDLELPYGHVNGQTERSVALLEVVNGQFAK